MNTRTASLLIGILWLTGASGVILRPVPGTNNPLNWHTIHALLLGNQDIKEPTPPNPEQQQQQQWQPIPIRWYLSIRLRQITTASLIGALLALSGLLLQQVFRNPLVSPYTLGVSGGATLGCALALILNLPCYGLAFAGGILAVTTLFGLVRIASVPGEHLALILGGIVLGAFFAMSTFLVLWLWGDTLSREELLFWLMGYIGDVSWTHLLGGFALLTVMGILAWRLAPLLDVLAQSEEALQARGHNPLWVRATTILIATVLTAFAVSLAGLLGFVGLVVPNLLRWVAGPTLTQLIPLCIMGGASFLVLALWLSHLPFESGILPIGVITAFLGTLFFLGLLVRRTPFQ